jgi:hypothetical protein
MLVAVASLCRPPLAPRCRRVPRLHHRRSSRPQPRLSLRHQRCQRGESRAMAMATVACRDTLERLSQRRPRSKPAVPCELVACHRYLTYRCRPLPPQAMVVVTVSAVEVHMRREVDSDISSSNNNSRRRQRGKLCRCRPSQ